MVKTINKSHINWKYKIKVIRDIESNLSQLRGNGLQTKNKNILEVFSM